MAGILQNVFSKGIYTLKDPENVSKLKTLVNHSALYFGLIVYTAIGAKVRNQDEIYFSHVRILNSIMVGIPNPGVSSRARRKGSVSGIIGDQSTNISEHRHEQIIDTLGQREIY